MKQHITIDQLNELSEKGKNKLGKWALNKPDIEWYYRDGKSALLSIGQMIEFLFENKYSFGLETDIGITVIYKFTGYEEKEEVSRNICDGLWSMVKEILEK